MGPVLLFLLFSSAVFSCLSSFMHIVLRLFPPSVCDGISVLFCFDESCCLKCYD